MIIQSLYLQVLFTFGILDFYQRLQRFMCYAGLQNVMRLS